MLQRAVAAAEAKDIGGIFDTWADDFTAHRMNRNQAKAFVFGHINRGQWRKVFLVSTDVELTSDTTADVATGAVLARGDSVTSLDDLGDVTRAEAYRFDLTLIKDGDWKIRTATYKRAGVQELLDPLTP